MTVIVIRIEQDGDKQKSTVVNNTNIAWAVDNSAQYAKELKAISESVKSVGRGLGLQADSIH